MRYLIGFVVVSVVLGVGQVARAQLVPVSATGEVTGFDPDPLLESMFSVGDPMTATMTYEASTPPDFIAPNGVAYFLNPLTDLSYSVGSFSGMLAAASQAVLVIDTDSTTLILINQFEDPGLPGVVDVSFELRLFSRTVFSEFRLPTESELDDFEPRFWSLQFFLEAGGSPNVFGRAAVEPTAQVEAIVAAVNALEFGGTINGGQARSLNAKLDAVLALLLRDQDGTVGAAVQILGAFMSQVAALVQNGTLSFSQGQDLIAAAQGVIATLTG